MSRKVARRSITFEAVSSVPQENEELQDGTGVYEFTASKLAEEMVTTCFRKPRLFSALGPLFFPKEAFRMLFFASSKSE